MLSKSSMHGRRRSPHHAWDRFIGASDGTAAVEFAIIAPLFIMILVGIIVFGLYFMAWIAVTQIASEVARAGLAGYATGEVSTDAAAQFLASKAGYGTAFASATIAYPTPAAGTFSVTVSYDVLTYFKLNGVTLLPALPKPSATVVVSLGSP